MGKQTGCSGNCGECGKCANCGGCGKSLTLTAGEIEMLEVFSQIPFLPVARRMGSDVPVYLEQNDHSLEEYSLLLQCLEKKGLISLDYDRPLKNFNDSAYADYPIRGSMALTARGQQVLELLYTQGID